MALFDPTSSSVPRCGRFSALVAVAMLLGATLGACDRKIAGGKVDGEAIFRSACSSCHGSTGVPSEGMVARLGVRNLTSDALHVRLSDADIRRQVLGGSRNKKMPGFKGDLTAEQLDALVTHLRSLRKPPPPS